jgi:hypothetical protein
MPLRFQIRRPLLRIIAEGDVDYNAGLVQLKQALEEARKSSPEALRWGLLFDLRKTTETRSDTELRGIAMALAQYAHMLTGRMALLVADAHHLQLSQTFGVFAEQLGHEPQIFEQAQDAVAWLKAERDSG